jgi:hypothetical protein
MMPGYITNARLSKAAAEISATAGERSLDTERHGRSLEKPDRRRAYELWPTTTCWPAESLPLPSGSATGRYRAAWLFQFFDSYHPLAKTAATAATSEGEPFNQPIFGRHSGLIAAPLPSCAIDDRVCAAQFFDPRTRAAFELAQVIKKIYSQIASQDFS